MDTVIFEILQIVVIAAIIIVTRYTIPAIKSYISSSNYTWIASVICDAVEQAEQTIKVDKSGPEKKVFVTKLVKKIFESSKIKVTDEQIDSLIESAVYTMNNAYK